MLLASLLRSCSPPFLVVSAFALSGGEESPPIERASDLTSHSFLPFPSLLVQAFNVPTSGVYCCHRTPQHLTSSLPLPLWLPVRPRNMNPVHPHAARMSTQLLNLLIPFSICLPRIPGLPLPKVPPTTSLISLFHRHLPWPRAWISLPRIVKRAVASSRIPYSRP